jgi:CRISPR-associated protein Cmr5
MSRKNIEKYIPKVMEVLNDEFQNGVISSVYNGYISTFGVSINQSGLKPTLALFENAQANTQDDRRKLTQIILKVLDSNYNETSLLAYVLENQQQEEILKVKIIDIAIALKLSIRTFKLDKGDKNE